MKNKVLVIGELCTDVFKYGITNRKSPEGSGPVFIQTDVISGNGMAGNTANNLVAMGLDVDTYFDNGKIMKTRYVNKDTNQLYLRVDVDDVTDRIDIYDLPDLIKYDAVVISDYCKGFLTEEDIAKIASLHNFVILDTKKKLGDWCKDIKFIKVNRQEFQNNFGVIKENDWLFEKIICTLDRGGAMYKTQTFKVQSVDTADVSGAGDTFVAGFVARYLDSENIEESIDWANYCAGEVVKEKGVSVFKNLKTI
jgi:D-beta-D-heptose 7-phosphate kinase/D-beta-D-heptose 1-phosphate adenosyltransferase